MVPLFTEFLKPDTWESALTLASFSWVTDLQV